MARRRAGRGWRARIVLCAALSLAGCGASTGDERSQRLEEGRGKLESDPSAALFVARDALNRLGEDPRLRLLAATACLRLERRTEALEAANAGLDADDLDDDLRADLEWARGTALAGHFQELSSDADWRAANTSLERATLAGSHRAEAAALLVLLQDLGRRGTPERQLRFARLLIQLEPDGETTARIRKLLEAKGLTP